ncbi:MAG: hypothetical protein ACI9U1_001705 [Porticoccaceae bacterium]|jgi:hypothetical protein|tara:strand:+ start:3644 stop:6106 length:2463 start_codon:yes stop_codon:yes gene_type:complete
MNVNKNLSMLYLFAATCLTACGGGGVGGDADQNVVRTLFAVGEVIEAVEDGGPVEGDVSANEQGANLSYAIASGSAMANGTLEFNADGTFIYTSNPDFFGTDSIDYVVTDTASGETDTATLTINVANDFEAIEEYGWQLVWSDEFNSDNLDGSRWEAVNSSVFGGHLVITAQDGMTSSVVGLSSMKFGRVEASVRAAAGANVTAAFKLAPVSDMYDGENSLVALESNQGLLTAGAHYGLGLTSGITMNADTLDTVADDFHIYAIEWGASEIRWYIDDTHVHTVDTLNTWAYNLSGGDIVADNAGPFNQDMQVIFDLTASGDGLPAMVIVDQIKVWTCDPSVESSVEDCASREKTKVSKQASDRIETVGSVVVDLFTDGYFDAVSGIKISDLQPLNWHYTDEIKELVLSTVGAIDVDVVVVEGNHDKVLDITSGSGTTSMTVGVEAVELIGLHTALNFDLYIDSAVTAANVIEIRLESGPVHAGFKRLNIADAAADTWLSFSIPIGEFLDNPILVDGDPMPLNVTQITSLMALEVQGEAHLQVDNINFTCINSESCIQGPLGLQSEGAPKAEPIRYEAEDYIAESGTGLEVTTDEGGGQNVGFLGAGDYLVYTINAPGIGAYSLDYRVASAGGSEGFEVSIDGVLVDSQTIPDTGDWQNWTTLTSQQFELVVGLYTLQIDFLGGNQNLNWFELLPPITEIFIEAEDYDNESGISLEDTTDEGGGENIGYIDEGDFVEYTVNIPSEGTYLIEYRLASAVDSFGFETSIGGVVVDTQELLATGDWQNWITQSAEVELVAGEQILRLDFLGGAINVNWIRLTRK